MSEAKHTPGPWRVSGKQSIRAGEQRYVAKATWDNGEANAHLIAAAPDLLEALQGLAALYDTDEGCRSMQQYIRARAAIAKATSAP